MPLRSLSPAASISFYPPSRSHSSATQLVRLRAPLVGFLGAFSLVALSALAYNMGCSQSSRRFPFFGVKSREEQSARSLHSTGMDRASTTVPSIVVYVTVPNKEAGKKLAESIITEKLAACVNRVPGIESVYWWDGKVQTDSEELLIIKTRESLLTALTEHVKSNHEYDVPEVIALPISGGHLKYLEWIKNSTRGD
ncbi:protein CutA 1, chloroplastic-like isoform X1 [Canna indica]|uniref:Protein CutA 1, chloroplastic-like isoform X1 n=1 Tax=Canna indica TaxID=4628 RepID=A0AAQ3KQD7_9LILI|nr:protein CutA 1, chloroplastic-like isoform X1 [Canna indica]